MTPRLKQQVLGEHVRRLRVQAGLSVRRLATQSGFSPSFMSQVETGQVSPSIGSMEKIAAALGVTLGDFFAAAAGGEGGLVVRVADRQALDSGWSNAGIEALSAPGQGARLNGIVITLRPRGRSGKHPYSLAHEEFAFVLQGEAVLTLGPDEHRLRRGDAAVIRAGEARLWRNAGRAPVRILIVTSTSVGSHRSRAGYRRQRANGAGTAWNSRERPRTPRTGPNARRRSSPGRGINARK